MAGLQPDSRGLVFKLLRPDDDSHSVAASLA